MRKRIVLSNTNALEVKMPDLNAGMVDELVRREWVNGDIVEDGALAIGERDASAVAGKVVGLMGSTVDSLRAVEAFKTTQGWGLFRRPALLVREEGVVLSRKLMDAQKNKSAVRLVLDGDRGTGKSLMLMHAMATAFVKGWVVLNIPEGRFHPLCCSGRLIDDFDSSGSHQCCHRLCSNPRNYT
jgi:small subunit ribosomal protein S29